MKLCRILEGEGYEERHNKQETASTVTVQFEGEGLGVPEKLIFL